MAALGHLASSLAAQSNDRERALGLFLQLRSAGDESRHALVRLATTSSDADAYALAIDSCKTAIGESANADCALLSYAQWARIEPDNAVPWLYLAGDAESRGDRSGLEAALYRASRAPYSDPHLDQLWGLLASDAVAAQSPAIQRGIAVWLIGVETAVALPYLLVPAQDCGITAQGDPNRVQVCGDLVATLVERSRTAVEVSIGGRIAERVGGTDKRLATLRDEADAMHWQMLQMQKPRKQDMYLLSCDSLQQLRRRAVAQVQFGESGWLRQELAASGVTTAQAAERWRALVREAALQQHENSTPTK